MKIFALIASLITLATVGGCATGPPSAHNGGPAPEAVAPDKVHSVMFYVTINHKTGVWTGAQVVGGFGSYEACDRAAPAAAAAASVDLKPGMDQYLLCPRINKHPKDSDAPDSDFGAPEQSDAGPPTLTTRR